MWKFFTRDVEIGERLVFCVSKRNLLYNPSRSLFRIEGYGLLASATGQQITSFVCQWVELATGQLVVS